MAQNFFLFAGLDSTSVAQDAHFLAPRVVLVCNLCARRARRLCADTFYFCYSGVIHLGTPRAL